MSGVHPNINVKFYPKVKAKNYVVTFDYIVTAKLEEVRDVHQNWS